MRKLIVKTTITVAALVWTMGLVEASTIETPFLQHSTDGVLFSDTFENQTVTGVQGTGSPTTANMSPGGANQQWFPVLAGSPNSGQSNSTVLTRNAASDAALNAYTDDKYVQINRPDNQAALLIADFGSHDYSTGMLTMQFAAYVTGPLNPPSGASGFVFRFDDLAGNTVLGNAADIAMQLATMPNGNINYIPTSGTSTATGLTWTPNQWQGWAINYNLDTDLFSLSVGSSSVSGLAAYHNLAVSRFSWQASNYQSGAFYLDELPIPEPSTVLLLVFGGGLLWRSRRRG